MSRFGEERGVSSGSDESHGGFSSIQAPDSRALADLDQLQDAGPVVQVAPVDDVGYIQDDYLPLEAEEPFIFTQQDELRRRLQAPRRPGC